MTYLRTGHALWRPLEPGASASGTIVWDVPTQFTPRTLTLRGSASSPGTTVTL
jgi:hypothetical protein